MTREDKVLKVLKTVGFKPSKPESDFESIYTHTLVEYGIEQPEAILKFFRLSEIKKAFQESFDKEDFSILNREAEGLIQWHKVGDDLRALDFNPRFEFARFTLVFNEMISLSRNPDVVRREQKLDKILGILQKENFEKIRMRNSTIRPKTSYKVFVSSTYLDNKERRRAVQDTITTAGMVWHGMELFSASTRPTVEECKRYAKEADLLVGIIAWRYGWIPEGEEKSITELEYDAAKERLMFQIDPNTLVNPKKDYDAGPGKWKKQEKLEAFKNRFFKDQTPAYFNETTLMVKVLDSLNKWRLAA